MNLVAIREALAERIRTETTLPVLEKPEGSIPGPSVLMGPPTVQYDQDMGAGVRVTWPLVVVVPRSHPDYLTTLANILSTGGVDDQSIPDAIDVAEPPSSAADWWRVTDSEAWTDLDIGNVSYWSATVNVEAVAS